MIGICGLCGGPRTNDGDGYTHCETCDRVGPAARAQVDQQSAASRTAIQNANAARRAARRARRDQPTENTTPTSEEK